MSLRKFMHPRNKYKLEPNFKQLAILYPEFRKIAITDLAGKVKINFHDLESLRVLAKTLLKHDFDINVEIPSSKLVPAIPSKLNYILWIEDLLKHSKVTDMSTISGLDIGTGAVCVYPLLFSKIYGCKMIGTEIDLESYDSALRNVNRNNLEHLIKVIRVEKDTVLQGYLTENESYSFTMCNPPFFCTQELQKTLGNRMPPRNAPSGSKVELVVEGGETQFVLKMLEDSVELKDKIKIYTTMLGKKTSLLFLRNELGKKGIQNTTWTEFCQGHTTRWGLAWTFLSKDQVDLTTAPVIRTSGCSSKSKKTDKRPPSEIIFPIKNDVTDTQELVTVIKSLMKLLKIRVEELDVNEAESSCWGCQLMADEDTWSHDRRKRRIMSKQNLPTKRIRLDISSEDISEEGMESTESTNDLNVKTIKGSFLLCNLVVGDIETEDNDDREKRLKISMAFESGTGGRNAMETLRQYIINKLNLREYLKEQKSADKSEKKQKARKKKKKKKKL